MKHHFRLILQLLVFIPFVCSARFKDSSKFYIRLSPAFSFNVNGKYLLVYGNDQQGRTDVSKLTMDGTGTFAGLAAGYQLLPHLGFELGGGYFRGSNFGTVNNSFNAYDDTSIYHSDMWQLIPSAVFSGSFGTFSPYLRIGLIVGFAESYTSRSFVEGDFAPVHVAMKTRYSGNMAIGIQTALGCTYHLPDQRFSVFAEAGFNSISYTPLHGDIYYYTINGKDELSSLQPEMKHTTYKQVVFQNTNSFIQSDYNLIKTPLNSVSATLGICMNFGKAQQDVSQPDLGHWFARIGAGQGFGTDPDYFTNFIVGGPSTTKMYSGGQGFTAGLAGSYMINPYLGFDLGISYIASSTFEYQVDNRPVDGALVTNAYHSSMFQLIPAVIFESPLTKHWAPYARFGLIGDAGHIYFNQDMALVRPATWTDKSWDYYGGINFGYQAALGTLYHLNKRCALFAEARFNSLYVTPQRGNLLKSSTNGVNDINTLTNRDRSIIFSTNFNPAVSNSDPAKPATVDAQKFSFNSVEAVVGLRIKVR